MLSEEELDVVAVITLLDHPAVGFYHAFVEFQHCCPVCCAHDRTGMMGCSFVVAVLQGLSNVLPHRLVVIILLGFCFTSSRRSDTRA